MAPLNVIKTPSLIISCTKPLHNSFCMHFDALWCILMHPEHLQENVLFLAPKSPILAHFIVTTSPLWYFSAQNIYTINSAYILMHFDAFWCIFFSFWAFKRIINHFFNFFEHKTLQNLFCMHFDAFWVKCIKKHHN